MYISGHETTRARLVVSPLALHNRLGNFLSLTLQKGLSPTLAWPGLAWQRPAGRTAGLDRQKSKSSPQLHLRSPSSHELTSSLAGSICFGILRSHSFLSLNSDNPTFVVKFAAVNPSAMLVVGVVRAAGKPTTQTVLAQLQTGPGGTAT